MKTLIMALIFITSVAASAADSCSIYVKKTTLDDPNGRWEPSKLTQKQMELEESLEEQLILKGYYTVEQSEDAKLHFDIDYDRSYWSASSVTQLTISWIDMETNKSYKIEGPQMHGNAAVVGFTLNNLKDCY